MSLALLLVSTTAARAQPSPTAITYQGSLQLDGEPYTGTADFRFFLFNAPTGGATFGGARTVPGVTVENGVFTAPIDFGATAHGPSRFLHVEVRTPAWDGVGFAPSYTVFPDRLPLTAAPYALQTRGITVNEAGNRVGIGTAQPNHPLHVDAVDLIATQIESSNPFGTWFNLRNDSANGRFWRLISTGSSNGEGAGKLLIGHGASPDLHTSVMAMDANGRVGIGTGNPQYQLDVAGSTRLGSSPTHVVEVPGGIRFGDATTQTTAYRPIVADVFLGTSIPVPSGSNGGAGQIVRQASVPGAMPGMTVIVNPPYRLWSFHTIGFAYVESPGVVAFSIVSTGGIERVYGAGTWRITVLP